MKCLCFLIVEEKKGMSEDVSTLELSQIVEEGGFNCLGDGVVGGSARMAIIAESISVLWESVSEFEMHSLPGDTSIVRSHVHNVGIFA